MICFEASEEAIRRDLREELGLEVQVQRPIWIVDDLTRTEAGSTVHRDE